VEAAAKVIGFDPDPKRRDKDIEPVSKEMGHLYRREFNNPDEEAKSVVKWINKTRNNMIDDPGDMAIIVRTHYRAEWIIQEMDRIGVPWFDRSRLNFQDSWETSLGLAIIELAHNPSSSLFTIGPNVPSKWGHPKGSCERSEQLFGPIVNKARCTHPRRGWGHPEGAPSESEGVWPYFYIGC